MEQTVLPHLELPAATGAPKRVPLAALWTLRLLVRGGILQRLIRRTKELDDDVRKNLEMPELDLVMDESTLRACLTKKLAAVEALGTYDDGVVFRNLQALAKLFQLTPVERALLTFAALMDDDDGLKVCLKQVGPTRDLYRLIAAAVGHSRTEVSRALRKTSTLRATRLVDLKPTGRYDAPLVLMEGLDDVLLRDHPRPHSLVNTFVGRSARAKLSADDFAHMRDAVELITSVAGGALRRHTKGVNILLYGPSGVGKTELVRVVAKTLAAALFEVSDEDADGDRMSDGGRLGACALAMRLLARAKRALLVFDEAEDAFPFDSGPMFGPRQRSTPEKSWTHRLLESSRVPTFWVTNEVEQIDVATLRRFDLAVEMRPPPRTLRQKLLEARLGKTGVRPDWISRAAADDRLTPAHVDQMGRVARLVGKRSPERIEGALSHVLDVSLSLSGSRSAGTPPSTPAPYDLRYLNASTDLERLARALAAKPRGTLCLYGMPGTGKSAFVHHVADIAGRPLIAARASDLFDKYVGQTEQKLARLFRRARHEHAVLLLDEADSFLRDRTSATQTWEVTQVNELLCQMEAFDGLFVCTTNLLETLDQASLRRFALKIRFDALKPEQAWALFAATVGAPVSDEREVLVQVERLQKLTPGDFAAVSRRLRMLGEPITTRSLLKGLREELAVKNGGGNVVGFR